MKRLPIIPVVSLMALAAGLVAAAMSCAPVTSGSKSESLAARIERGRQLTIVGACNDCHTPGFFYGDPDLTRQLSGSEVGWVGPWGTTFPRNLTPDPETGLGRWSEADIVRTLRTGVRPDGSPLKPPMPWMNVSSLPDEDLFAIAAYLKSLPPVKHRAPDALPPEVAPPSHVLRFPPPPQWDGSHLVASAVPAAK